MRVLHDFLKYLISTNILNVRFERLSGRFFLNIYCVSLAQQNFKHCLKYLGLKWLEIV
jgi:hypothetical protein